MRIILFVMVFVHCQLIAQPLERMMNFVELDVYGGSNLESNAFLFLDEDLYKYIQLSLKVLEGGSTTKHFHTNWQKLLDHKDSTVVKMAEKMLSYPIHNYSLSNDFEHETEEGYWATHDSLAYYYHEKYGLPNYFIFDSLSRIKSMFLQGDYILDPYGEHESISLTYNYKFNYKSLVDSNPDSYSLEVYNQKTNKLFFLLEVNIQLDESKNAQYFLSKEEYFDVNGEVLVKSQLSYMQVFTKETDMSILRLFPPYPIYPDVKTQSTLIDSKIIYFPNKQKNEFKKLTTTYHTDTSTIYNLKSDQSYKYKHGLFKDSIVSLTDKQLEAYYTTTGFLEKKDYNSSMQPSMTYYGYYEDNVLKMQIRVIYDFYKQRIHYCDGVTLYPSGKEMSEDELKEFVSSTTIYELTSHGTLFLE